MIIPDAAVTKALFIIDVQPLTLKGDLPPAVTEKIVRFIEKVPYDATFWLNITLPSHQCSISRKVLRLRRGSGPDRQTNCKRFKNTRGQAFPCQENNALLF